MIEASGLSKSYGDVEAVKSLSFTIGKGEVVGLLGPNGAGKTSTMRMLTSYLPPSAGTAKVAGFDIRRDGEEVRRRIGYLPETPPLYPEMRVREYLFFMARIRGVASRAIRAAVDQVIERCILGEVEKRLCGELSRGFRQRVGLAQALVHKPEVIILDEPTSGLDPAQIISIRKLIRKLEGEHTVVLSTHILPEVSQTCSQAIIISGGRLVVQGPVAELTKKKSLEERFLEAVAGDAVETSRGLEAVPDEHPARRRVNQ